MYVCFDDVLLGAPLAFLRRMYIPVRLTEKSSCVAQSAAYCVSPIVSYLNVMNATIIYIGSRDLVEGVHSGQAGCGKLLLATDAAPEVLNNLRCVQVQTRRHIPGTWCVFV